jgi:hypothetical protein
MLDGLSNLFRLHFAITGEYDYREPFILSMKFPNEETSDARQAAKQNSLNLSTQVLQTISGIIGAINDPLPPEVIQDILTKFSFLDPNDIKKWIKPNPNAKEHTEEEPQGEEFGADAGGAPMGGMDAGANMGGDMGGDTEDMGMDMGGDNMGGDNTPPPPEDNNPLAGDINKQESRKKYLALERIALNEQKKAIRFNEAKDKLAEAVIKQFSQIDEANTNNRHYKFARIESCLEPMYNLFQKKEVESLHEDTPKAKERKERVTEVLNENEGLLSWTKIRESLIPVKEGDNSDDVEHLRRINEMLS